jgi:hypothetical protein
MARLVGQPELDSSSTVRLEGEASRGYTVDQVPRWTVAAVIVAIPLQDLALSHSEGLLQLAARYGPEAVAAAAAVAFGLRARTTVLRRVRFLLVPLGAVVGLWLLSGVVNRVSLSTMAIGLRSELRWLPLAVLVIAAAAPLADARLYGRLLVYLGAAEGTIAVLEAVGGKRIRTAFEPNYHLAVGGVDVGRASPGTNQIPGTFADRHVFALFLVGAIVVLAAAGPRALGLSRRGAIAVAILIGAGVVLSGSREAGLALVPIAATLALLRYGRRAAKILTAVGAVGVCGVLIAGAFSGPGIHNLDSPKLANRWQALLGRDVWSPKANFRMRLVLDNSVQVWRHDPVLGFGLGTGSDPRLIEDLSSPVYRSFGGWDLAKDIEPYVYDGNWAILILETGFVGIALAAVFFAALARVGLRAREHWAGRALIALIPAVMLLGFATTVLQQRSLAIVLWLMIGLAVTAAAENGSKTVQSGSRYSSQP